MIKHEYSTTVGPTQRRNKSVLKGYENTEAKIKCYEKAKSILLEGGITPSNLEKNYIEPQKKVISQSNLRKRSCQISPPKFTPHSNQYNEHKKHQAQMEKDLKEKKILDECTFSPNIDFDRYHVRDADEFYYDQQVFEHRKIAKLHQLEKEIQDKENATHRPFLSKISEEIMQKKKYDDKPIHERLYSDSNTR